MNKAQTKALAVCSEVLILERERCELHEPPDSFTEHLER